jgi:MoaA/NifB/PqqE/SkfB family radical SAM enzyme
MSKPSIELWLELETRCNLACKFCYNFWKDGSAPAPQLKSTLETAEALRALLEQLDVTQVAFSGGEPLLRPDLLELIELVHSYDVPAILTTNGTLLTRQRIQALSRSGIASFQIPIHSHLSEVHDYLSAVPSWHKALAAMIRVYENGLPLVPIFVATCLNIDHFPAVIRMLGQLDVTQIIFNRFIPTGLGTLFKQDVGVPDDKQIIEVLSASDEVVGAFGSRVLLGTPVEVPRSMLPTWRNIDLASCPVEAGQRRWTLSPDLTLRRCNQSGANIGSVLDGGIEVLIRELQMPRARRETAVRPCSFLAPKRLVTIEAAPKVN